MAVVFVSELVVMFVLVAERYLIQVLVLVVPVYENPDVVGLAIVRFE